MEACVNCERLQAEVEALRLSRDALARDAERYRWLIGMVWQVGDAYRWHWQLKPWKANYGESLDAAIDTAMRGKP